jgi:hypothetical protein
MMLAKESDGLRAEAERLCESDQEAHACQWSSTKGIVLPALNIVQGVQLCVCTEARARIKDQVEHGDAYT